MSFLGPPPFRESGWGREVIKRAEEIANRALDVKERENRFREEIKRGSTPSRVLELEKWEKEG